MPKLVVISRTGIESEVEGQAELSVMEVIRRGGLDEMLALCGGSCSCATCHVHVDPAFLDRLPSIGTDESDLLDSSACRNASSRLSCQIRLTEALDGLRVAIAPED